MAHHDDKALNYAKLLGAHADKIGYKVGEKLPDVIVGLLDYLVQKGKLGSSFEELVPGAHGLLRGALKILGQIGEVPLSAVQKLLPGFVGEVGYEFINEFIDAAGRGAGDSPKAGEKASEKNKTGVGDDGSRKGFVKHGIWYPNDCTHEDPPFVQKGGSPQTRIPLVEALRRGHGHCERGCVSAEEVKTAKEKLAAIAAASPATDKTPAATPTSKSEAPAVKIGQYLHRMRNEDPISYIQLVEKKFLPLIKDDHDLMVKFFKAFKSGISYEQFCSVLEQPRTDWHILLDTYIDEVPTGESKWDRELKEFAGMLDGLNDLLDAITPWAEQQSKASKKRLDGFRAKRDARNAERESRAVVTTYVLSGVMLLAFLVYLFANNYLPS